MIFSELAAHSWTLGTMGLLLLASAFFSGSETALFSLTAAQKHKLKSSRNWFSTLAVGLTDRPRRLLNTLLLGNMLINVAYSSTVAVLVLELRSSGGAGWLIGAVSLLGLLSLILFGEVMPKMLAFSTAQKWSTLAAGPIYVIQNILHPILWVLETILVGPIAKIAAPRSEENTNITGEELSALMSLSARRGIIDHEAGDLIREITELTDVKAGDVMVPRVDVISYDVDDKPAGLIKLFKKTHLRKIPVFEKNLDNVLGLIYAKHLLLMPTTPLRELLQPVSFVPETANLDRVLMQFRVMRKQMAIVVDEYGGSAGLITLEDVLEEIVGDIPDTSQADLPESVQKLSDVEYLIRGDLSVRDWVEVFRIDLSHHRISTLGGLVTWLLGKIPQPGDVCTFRNLQFTVEKIQGRRVRTLRLKLAEDQS